VLTAWEQQERAFWQEMDALVDLYLFTQDEIPPYYRAEDINRDPRDLYFDLNTGDFQYYQVTRMRNNPTWVPVTECFNGAINPVDIANEKASEEQNLGILIERYYDNLNQLRGIRKRTYPIQIVPATASVDDAIMVHLPAESGLHSLDLRPDINVRAKARKSVNLSVNHPRSYNTNPP
jgi:hypothetical protein